MARVAIVVLAGALGAGACTFDWDAYDPRERPVTQGGNGGMGTGGRGGADTTGGGGVAPTCGDGVVTGDEQCDDANDESGDGCSDACTVECAGLLDGATGHCYVIVNTEITWDAARASCAALGDGFDLSAISSQAEQDFLIAQTSITDVLVPDDNSEVLWLGGTDVADEGTWLWSNGEPFFENWVAGEPSNDGANGEHCAVYIHRDDIIGYDDRPCDETYAHLCERARPGS